MKVFIYEYVTGGGMWEQHPAAETQNADNPAAASLLNEGRAMVAAVAEDFFSLPGVQVLTTRDARLPPLHPASCSVTLVGSRESDFLAIERLVREADWTLLIAPETGGALARRCKFVLTAGGRLLSPGPDLVSLVSDKQATADFLASRGMATPKGVLVSQEKEGLVYHGPQGTPIGDIQFPAVVKPIDGCGSEGVRLVKNRADLAEFAILAPMRLEEFVPGLAASVAVLCGPAGNHALPACEQRQSADGRFRYLGGRLPLRPALDQRARRLATSAVAALPQPLGYVGVDLVLGSAGGGSGDRVIEINPRVTTSYVGLRAAARGNLAAAMLAVAMGRAPEISFSSESIEFAANGAVCRMEGTTS